MILLKLRTNSHDSVGHWYFFIENFDIFKLEIDGMRVFGILEEEDLEEEPFPSLECIPLKTPDMHDGLFWFLIIMFFFLMG